MSASIMYLTIWAKCPFTSHFFITGSCGKRARKQRNLELGPKLSDPHNHNYGGTDYLLL